MKTNELPCRMHTESRRPKKDSVSRHIKIIKGSKEVKI